MPWPPQLPKLPKSLDLLFKQYQERIDAITPKEGTGIRVTDATGGGKMIDAIAPTGLAGVPLRDCVFFDSIEEEFFLTDLLTTGRHEPISPP